MKNKIFQTFLIDTRHEVSVAQIKEHLRYWPYVKAFADNGARSIKVRVCIGQISNPHELHHYISRSRDLILSCLRQYGVVILPTDYGWFFFRHYEDSLFLRPDHLVRDFRSFIDEIDGVATNHSTF